MLAQPRGEVLIAVVTILVEYDHHRADFARKAIGLADKNLLPVPIANRLAQIDSVQDRRSERLDPDALFREHRLGFLLQEASVILNDEIFGRIGADRIAGGLLGPLAGNLLSLTRLDAGRTQALFRAGQAATNA